jgi:hypothetical protein
VPIQIEQKFPRCNRCGKMIHFRASRIEAEASDAKVVVFCSEICRDEYADLFTLASAGTWRGGRPTGQRRA